MCNKAHSDVRRDDNNNNNNNNNNNKKGGSGNAAKTMACSWFDKRHMEHGIGRQYVPPFH